MADAAKYLLTVFWSEEDEAFIAEARDLPGCSAIGDTQAEAVAQAQDAIEAWLQAAAATGRAVPSPSVAAAENSYSGKFVVRVPRSLHAALARRAAIEGVSLNQLAVYLLSQPAAQLEAQRPQPNRPAAIVRRVAVGRSFATGLLTSSYSDWIDSLSGNDVVKPRLVKN